MIGISDHMRNNGVQKRPISEHGYRRGILLIGHKKWLETAAKLGTWFVSGETCLVGDSDLALKWLQG
jgi:hypothetical protein